MFKFRNLVLRGLLGLFQGQARIERRLTQLQEKTMSQLDDLITKINDATNAVATRIDNLRAELAAAISQGQAPTQSQLDELAAISTHLQAMGADATDPVPAAPATSTTDPTA